jgi:hypothetical protein
LGMCRNRDGNRCHGNYSQTSKELVHVIECVNRG